MTDYLIKTGLQSYLDKLGFETVGYGCTTCIGNSGPLDPDIEKAVTSNDLVAASVLSGNRNFEARVHQNIKSNFLMSPPLVVAFALAGRADVDMSSEPIGKDSAGQDVYLKDLWPSLTEIRDQMSSALKPEVFKKLYADFAEQNPKWNEIRPRPAMFTSGTASPLIFRSRRSSRTSRLSPAPSPRSRARGPWAFLATRSRPITFRPPAPSRRTRRPVVPRGKRRRVRRTSILTVHGVQRPHHDPRHLCECPHQKLDDSAKRRHRVEGGLTIHHPVASRCSSRRLHEIPVRRHPLVVSPGRNTAPVPVATGLPKAPASSASKPSSPSFERIHRSNLVGMASCRSNPRRVSAKPSVSTAPRPTTSRSGEPSSPTGCHPYHHSQGRHQDNLAVNFASIPPSKSTTTATAASCSTSCANSLSAVAKASLKPA